MLLIKHYLKLEFSSVLRLKNNCSRVLADLTIAQLRSELQSQLEDDALPPYFAYVRGVGRHFTEVGIQYVQLCRFVF